MSSIKGRVLCAVHLPLHLLTCLASPLVTPFAVLGGAVAGGAGALLFSGDTGGGDLLFSDDTERSTRDKILITVGGAAAGAVTGLAVTLVLVPTSQMVRAGRAFAGIFAPSAYYTEDKKRH